jgi:hypothetical protein
MPVELLWGDLINMHLSCVKSSRGILCFMRCLGQMHKMNPCCRDCLSLYLPSNFICVTKQITLKFSICVCCSCHVNFILLIVSQVWPLLHTKPNFKLSDVLIWSSLFMAMEIHVVVFCVTRSRVDKHADANLKKTLQFVYVNMTVSYISSSLVHPYLHSTL